MLKKLGFNRTHRKTYKALKNLVYENFELCLNAFIEDGHITLQAEELEDFCRYIVNHHPEMINIMKAKMVEYTAQKFTENINVKYALESLQPDIHPMYYQILRETYCEHLKFLSNFDKTCRLLIDTCDQLLKE